MIPFLLDYSMFFGATLLDYYEASGDRETLEDLSKCAYRQMEIAGEQFDAKHLMKNGEGFWGFIDWTEGLNKQTAMQGVYIYCAKKVQKIAEILGDTAKAEELKKEAEEKTAAVRKYLLDEKTGLFVSGEEKQINYASQVWLILAGAVSIEEGSAMLDKLDELKPEKGMVSPYMNHHYVEALLMCGKKDQAMDYMKYYWGGSFRDHLQSSWRCYYGNQILHRNRSDASSIRTWRYRSYYSFWTYFLQPSILRMWYPSISYFLYWYSCSRFRMLTRKQPAKKKDLSTA